MSTITWPGLPGGPITFSFPVSTEYIVPAWRTLQRPGIKARSPRRSVQHENGNRAAYARQDSIYLYNGAGGRQASWHCTVDHMEGYINLPADEVGWQAGDGAGPGNYNGIACELSQRSLVGTAAENRAARRNAAEFLGRAGARLSIADPDYHDDFMRKNCPEFIRNNATYKREYEADWWSFYNDEKARMKGTAAPTTGFKVGDRFEVIAAALNIRTGWGLTGRVVAALTPGRTGAVIADGEGRYTTQADGYTWLNVRIDGFGTGWIATGVPGDDWIAKTTAPAPEPAPKPTYTAPLKVPALLETQLGFEDKYHTVEGITTVNELEFIFVADVIEFTETTKALAWGDLKAPEAKAPYQKHDRVIAAWLVKGNDGVWYYLLTGGDDEWVRVEYVNTVRVSDAPLLGDSMH